MIFCSQHFSSGGGGPPPVFLRSNFLLASFFLVWLWRSCHFFLTSFKFLIHVELALILSAISSQTLCFFWMVSDGLNFPRITAHRSGSVTRSTSKLTDDSFQFALRFKLSISWIVLIVCQSLFTSASCRRHLR